MAREFLETTIGEFCSVGDGAHAKVARQESGVLYLTSKNIGNGNLKLDSVDYISKEDFEQLFQRNSKAVRRVRPGDVLIGIIGTFGNAYLYKDTDRFGISSSIAILRPEQSVLDSHFLYYVVTSKTFKDTHAAYKNGSVQGYTNIPTIKSLPITLPPLDEQKAIAHILGTLDDKIELNREMNHTLEAIARALFKSWFIDFDPVRAKMEGRQPAGMDAETAALFPAEFEDSALGKIPKGWRVGFLGEEFQITMGQSPPSSTYNEICDGLPFYQGKTDFGFRYPSLRVFCNAPTRFAEKGDTLVSVRAPVGNINMAHQKCCIGRGVAAVRHKQGNCSYTYYLMGSLSAHFAKFEAEGTVFGSISKQDFLKTFHLVPPQKLVYKFEQIAHLLDKKIENQEEQSYSFISIRDALVPKLISGEIRVKDAEKVVDCGI